MTQEERDRRYTRRWYIASGAIFAIFLSIVMLLQGSFGAKIEVFRAFCQALRRHYPLAAVREEAVARGLLYEEDPDPSGFTSDTGYVIRPLAAWPYRYGCRIWASRGLITRIER